MNANVKEVVETRRRSAIATPMQMLALAVERGDGIDQLKQLMDLRDRWEATEAKKAYVAAFAEFKQNMPDVVKDMLNKQYDSDYSSLANLVNTTNRSLGEYDLNATWKPEVNGTLITCTCILTHAGGHSESVTLSAPPDNTGAKNTLQQMKSTLTYLEGATFQAITGVVARSASKDDDGNGAGKAPEPVKVPPGYESWKVDMEAKAEEGYEPFSAAWKATAKWLREHALKVDAEWRQKTIAAAKAADEARLK